MANTTSKPKSRTKSAIAGRKYERKLLQRLKAGEAQALAIVQRRQESRKQSYAKLKARREGERQAAGAALPTPSEGSEQTPVTEADDGLDGAEEQREGSERAGMMEMDSGLGGAEELREGSERAGMIEMDSGLGDTVEPRVEGGDAWRASLFGTPGRQPERGPEARVKEEDTENASLERSNSAGSVPVSRVPRLEDSYVEHLEQFLRERPGKGDEPVSAVDRSWEREAEVSGRPRDRGKLVKRGVGGGLGGRSGLLPFSTHLDRAGDNVTEKARLEQQRNAIRKRREALLLEEVEIEVKLRQLREGNAAQS